MLFKKNKKLPFKNFNINIENPKNKGKNTIIIINPKAGKKIFLNLYLPLVETQLKKYNIKYETIFTKRPGDATIIAKNYAKLVDFIIIFGGDGTVREVVEGIKEYPIPIGIIPFGTVNVLALDLKIPFNPIKATNNIIEGNIKKIDIGIINNKPFLLMCSSGIDALAVHNVNLNAKKILGPFAYIFSAIKSLIIYRPHKITIKIVDKNIVDEGFLVIISNSRFYGGKFIIDRNTSIDDGLLNIFLFKKGSIKDTFRLFAGVLLNKIEQVPGIVYYKGKEIYLNSQKKVYLQIDGDKAPPPPAHITINKKAISIFSPKQKKKQSNIIDDLKKLFSKK